MSFVEFHRNFLALDGQGQADDQQEDSTEHLLEHTTGARMTGARVAED